jgi:hypothetical protein
LDWDDPATEARWLVERRNQVDAYLVNEGMLHGHVAESPSWFVAPYLSIWKVHEGGGSRLWLWAIAGDLPSDFVAADEAVDERTALGVFAAKWLVMATAMAAGRASDHGTIGSPEDWPALAPLLRTRATLMREWADDDGMWDSTS